MLILSTFNSDYLQNPSLKDPQTLLLKSLFEKFTKESIEIKYVNKNLIGELIGLKIEKLRSCAILFRIFDFLETDSNIDLAKLEEHLSLILEQIILIKQKSVLPFIVFLCPSPEIIYSEDLKKIEEKYIEKFNNNKIHVLSLSNIREFYSIKNFENPIEGETHIPYLPEFYTAMASLLARKYHAIVGKKFKLIAVDCDNTLWTGVAAEEGANGVIFEEQNLLLQKYLVEQHARGVIICLCSKNDEQTVIDVFNWRGAEMPLKVNHLSNNNKINWRSKSENIKELAKELNLFPDSFLFIDDNPIEIREVRINLGITCVTAPQNSRGYRNELRLDIDEHQNITESDKNRASFYSKMEIKAETAKKFNDPLEYLRSPELGQSIIISKLDSEEDVLTIQRVSQLTGKTNQFNIFPESKAIGINDINSIIISETRDVFIGRIKDNFSSEDITAVAVTSISRKSLIINSFFVSCRVFNRGMEYEMLKHIAQFALEKNKKYIKLNFRRSKKNNIATKFLNVLNEEKNPNSKYLFDKTKTHVWLHTTPKFLLKTLNLYVDFRSFEVDEESSLRLSARKIASINLDTIIRKALNITEEVLMPGTSKLTETSNELTEKYLVELKEMTSSLERLQSQFFLDNTITKSITALDIRINILCNYLLGEEGQDKSLVARGLDSLKATELRSALYENEKIIIPIQMLLCEKTTSTTLVDHIKQQEIFSEKAIQNNNFYNQILPVSSQQQRIWLAEQQELSGNSSNYHMTACYKLPKNVNLQLLKTACYELIKLYDVFGTTFFIHNRELKQKILPPNARKLLFKIKNLQKPGDLEEAIKAEINVFWTMSSEPLIRFTVFKETTENNYYIFFHVHHAIFDASSLSNCLDSLSKIYSNLTGHSSSPISFPPQYIDFIYDQQKKLTNEVYQTKASNFWKNKFSQIENLTILPTDQQLSNFKATTELLATRYTFSLSFEKLSALKSMARTIGVTCFSVVNGLFAFLIASYTYQKNVTTITASNGRSEHPAYEKMAGFFVNLLVQQFDLNKRLQLDEYLKNAHKNFLLSQEFQDISFEKIQKFLPNPVFIYQSYPISQFKLNEEHSELVLPKQPIIFDLRETCRFSNFTLFAQEYQDELHFVIEYARDFFSPIFIKSFAENLIYTITNACSNPKISLHDLSVVCDEEREQLLSLSQGPKLNLAKKIGLLNKIQQVIRQYPENIALSDGEIRLSYREVDQQSTNLALALIEEGVKLGSYVGIFLDASYLFFIAELALIKIGAVFVPLSKENPKERLQFIINDAKVSFFIVDEERKEFFSKNSKIISIALVNNFNCLEKNLPQLNKAMNDAFCILYTSGSTGTPKGVILTEEGIFRVIESPNFISVSPGDNFAQTANHAFDAAQLEFLLAMCYGARLVLFSKEILLNIKAFRSKLISEKIHHIWVTAGMVEAYINNQPDAFSTEYLITLMLGGDRVHLETLLKILYFSRSLTIVNGFGPTEAAIFVLSCVISGIEKLENCNTVPIGSPINETTLKIITPFGTLTPLGGIGELVVSGEGVAKGYVNKSLNKDRFIKGSYHTGDLVKYTKELQVTFIGRKDTQQIKVNGNLVALEEVRSCLSRYPAIKQVEVSACNIGEINQLVAFYTLKSANAKAITNEEFHKHLSKSLPFYMFPKFFKQVDDFLVNINGKLDKTQFVRFESELKKKQYEEIPPKTLNGNILLEIIQKILPNFPNNIKQNLFEFGCDSLKSVYIINSINDYFESEFIQNFKSEFLKIFKIESESEFEKYYDEFKDYINFISFHNIEIIEQKKPTIEKLEKILGDKLNTKTNQKSLELFKKLKNKTQSQAFELFNKLKHETESLRLLKDGDSSLPAIVFIHPAGGGINCFNKLLEQVNFDNICYGIEDPLLNNNLLKLLSMEQMARNYLAIINNEIQGPFILVGYSFGGMLALEMATQHEFKSENPCHLKQCILIDTWVVSCLSEDKQVELKNEVLMHCSEQRKKTNISENSEILNRLEILCEHHQEIGFSYKPRRLSSTPVFLFKATIFNEKFKEMHSYDENNFLLKFLDSKLFKSEKINATHYNMLENVKNNSLAELFSNKINEISNVYIKVKKIDLGGHSSFFAAPSEDMNDPKFHLHEPKIKK